MLHWCIPGDPWKWDLLLPLMLFILRDTPLESLKYSPFELVLGHRPRSLLQMLREDWEVPVTPPQDASGYRHSFHRRLQIAREIAAVNLQQAQWQQKEKYDKQAKQREFQLGQKVLVLLPTSTSKLLTQWQGPFKITRRVGSVDYKVYRPGHLRTKQIYHVNLLREWRQPEGWATSMEEEDLGPQGEEVKSEPRTQAIQVGENLRTAQKGEIQALIAEFKDTFREEPGWVQGTYHYIQTPPGAIVRDRW